MRDLLSFLSWYLIITVVGLLTLPIVYRYFVNLRDRGYAFIRGIGLLLWGFIFWFLASLGIVQNNIGGQVFALIVICLFSGLILRKQGLQGIVTWMAANKKMIIATELVFLCAFALWAFIRSANPEIVGTEKPMELAFINSILASPGIPPHDPWLSGYAISYYYFGYVMVAMLIRLSGVLSGIGFNLAIALWFGLSAVGAYGIIYNLLSLGKRRRDRSLRGDLSLPLSGPLFLLIMANLEGVLEILHARSLFWKRLPDGSLVSSFWKWLDILDLSSPPAEPFSWFPTRYLPWWRASRVLQDYDLLNASREIIDEFPNFTFLLADLHPHLLATPFVLLGIMIALNLFHGKAKTGLSVWGIRFPLTWDELLFTGLCLGGLGFLNIWDFPFSVLLFSGVYLLKGVSSHKSRVSLFLDSALLFITILLAGFVMYLPYYLSFSSQAGGLIPSLLFFTRGAHFGVMFGSLLAPIMVFLFMEIRTSKSTRRFGQSLLFSCGLFLAAFILMIVAGWFGWMIPAARPWLEALFNSHGHSFLSVMLATIQRRMMAPGTWLTLLLITTGIHYLLRRKESKISAGDMSFPSRPDKARQPPEFILIVMAVGILLLSIPEFFYLRDLFGWRMNTIFKFYYHAWILLSISGAYALIRVFQQSRGWLGVSVKTGLMIILIASLVYAPVMLEIKSNHFGKMESRTLDGNRYFSDMYPDEAKAVAWLSTKPPGILAEAIGGSYTGYARVSTLTGYPTVLGWPGHEGQWRGGDEEMGTRAYDIEKLYSTNDWSTAESIIRQYAIRYIFIGNLERATYHVNDGKFIQHLPVVFDQGSVIILEVVPYD